jgi:hypothetical protein
MPVNPPIAVQRTPAGAAGRQRRRLPIGPIAVAVAVAVALVLVGTVTAGPHHVARLTVRNATPYHVDVEVTDGGHHGWTLLGTAERGATGMEQVVDQGDTWVFRFTAQTRVSAPLTITRAELDRRGWRLDVPTRFGDALVADGVVRQP